MDVITIHGGRPLRGTVQAAGSKNAALPIMAASILADGQVVLESVPDVADVDTLALLLGHLGVEVKRDREGIFRLDSVDALQVKAEFELVSRMRASFCVLGPLLARRGKAIVALPGGCRIGPRPVDLHLRGLAALGADIQVKDGNVLARAKALHGAKIDLSGQRGSTVTGTANVLSAAVLARGETVIHGAAREPEIVDLGEFLISLGAKIDGLGTDILRIRGVTELGGTGLAPYRIIPDRMETGTMLLAAATTGGDVTVNGCRPGHLDTFLALLDDAGIAIDIGPNWIRAATSLRALSFHITALPHPGVPTDLQPPLAALAALADGESTITDCVFPTRFGHVEQLQRLGANICCCGATATIVGVDGLYGNRFDRRPVEITASDLRAGAALVLAGLSVDAQATVCQAHHLARGYERFAEKLRSLGAGIETNATAVVVNDEPRSTVSPRGYFFDDRCTSRYRKHVTM
jgi:UDP-N-acetylglucosamine 1-carboxyvinyltransferase